MPATDCIRRCMYCQTAIRGSDDFCRRCGMNVSRENTLLKRAKDKHFEIQPFAAEAGVDLASVIADTHALETAASEWWTGAQRVMREVAKKHGFDEFAFKRYLRRRNWYTA